MSTLQKNKTKELLLAATMFGAVAGTTALARNYVVFSLKKPVSEATMKVNKSYKLSPSIRAKLRELEIETNKAYRSDLETRMKAVNNIRDFSASLAVVGFLFSLLSNRFTGYGKEITRTEKVGSLNIPVSHGKVPCPDAMAHPVAKLYGFSIPLVVAMGPAIYYSNPSVAGAIATAAFMGAYLGLAAYSFTNYCRVKVEGLETESESERKDMEEHIKELGRFAKDERKRRWSD